MLRFRLGSIPVQVHASFLLMGVMLGFRDLNDPLRFLSWNLIVFASILVHELGHALAFRRFGHTPRIELYALGGLTYGTPGTETTPGRELIIALAGPLAGFGVGGLAWALYTAAGASVPPFGDQLLRDILWVNVGWGLLNLLPLYPLDGGQALSAGLRALAPVRGERVALMISIAVAIGAAWVAISARWLWPGFIAGWSGVISFQNLQRAMERGDDGVHDPIINKAYGLLRAGKLAEARSAGEAVLAQALNPLVRKDVLQLLAWTYLGEERAPEAWRMLEQLPAGQTSDPELRGKILLRIPGREKEAIQPLSHVFGLSPSAALGSDLTAALIHGEDLEGAAALVLGPTGAKLDNESHAEIERALFFAGKHAQSLEVSALRFERFKESSAAYNAACAACRMNQPEVAMQWIERAFSAGYTDVDHLKKDEDLALIHGNPKLAGLLNR